MYSQIFTVLGCFEVLPLGQFIFILLKKIKKKKKTIISNCVLYYAFSCVVYLYNILFNYFVSIISS